MGGEVDPQEIIGEASASRVVSQLSGRRVAHCGGADSMLAAAMPPPPQQRPSVKMLSARLGMSGPLDGDERIGACGLSSPRERRWWHWVS